MYLWTGCHKSLNAMGVAPWNTPVCPQATSILVTHTFNIMWQKHSGNCQLQNPPIFFRIFEQKNSAHKNSHDIVRPWGHPMMPKKETKKCCVTLQLSPNLYTQLYPVAHWVCTTQSMPPGFGLLLSSLGTVSDLLCSPSLQSLLFPRWPSEEAGVPSMSDPCQRSPALSSAWPAAQLNQSRT